MGARRSARPASSGRRWLTGRRIVTIVAVVAGTALAVRVLINSSDELFTAADDLTGVAPLWVLVAVGAEAVCYLARGGAQRLLLVAGTAGPAVDTEVDTEGGTVSPIARAGTVVLAGTTLAGDAVAYCLPFGFAAAGVVTLRILRRRRIGEVLAGWMFGVATLLYVAVLAVLGIVAAELAGDQSPAGLQEVSTVLLVALLATLVVVLALRAGSDTRWARVLTRPLRRLGRRLRVRHRLTVRWLARGRVATRRPPGAAELTDRGEAAGAPALRARVVARLRGVLRVVHRRGSAWWAQLRLLRVGPATLAGATAAMLVSWAGDIGVLAASYAALGAVPPWPGLLLAYCAGQIASSVPITPGGIGVVEGSLTLALVAFGGSTQTTLAAVLLYRLISHWAVVPAGALAWLALRLRTPLPPDREVVEVDPSRGPGSPATTSPTSTEVGPA